MAILSLLVGGAVASILAVSGASMFGSWATTQQKALEVTGQPIKDPITGFLDIFSGGEGGLGSMLPMLLIMMLMRGKKKNGDADVNLTNIIEDDD